MHYHCCCDLVSSSQSRQYTPVMNTHVSMLDALSVMRLQAGVDVSKHGGHAYPGMEDVYNVELQHMAGDDIMTDVPDHKFHGSREMDYPGSHSSKLQSQVICNI